MRSFLIKNNFKRSLQKHHFVNVYEVIITYIYFITYLIAYLIFSNHLLIFPPSFNYIKL